MTSKRNIRLSIVLIGSFFTGLLTSSVSWVVSGVAFFIAVCTFIFLFGTRSRLTKKGYEAVWHLKGFKQFLSVTNKDRFKFHNTPGRDPKQFMEYLPYAIAFGVEKEWAKAFEDITLTSPDWFESEVTGSTFSSDAFTKDMSAFASSFSSSSGSSGSSGGGSAGGGSGGGGGGSW